MPLLVNEFTSEALPGLSGSILLLGCSTGMKEQKEVQSKENDDVQS